MVNQFEILPEKLCEPFCISIHIEDSILKERVYRSFPISINHKNTMDNLVEFDMVNFSVILSIDWLHACYPSIDCRIRVVLFKIPNEPVIEWCSSSVLPKVCFILYLMLVNFVLKGFIYHLIRANGTSVEVPSLQSVPMVKEIPKMFPDDLLRVLPKR